MKKIALYTLLLATGILAGCSDSYDDWASPQGYDPESPISISFSVTAVAGIEMANVTTETVAIFTPVLSIPEGAVVSGYEAILDDQVTLGVDANGNVEVQELVTAVSELYGKRPEARTMAEKVNVYVDIDGQVVTTSAETTLTVTLDAPFIASAYYFVGDMCGWDEESMIAFNHSNEDVYSDPVFTVTFSCTDNQYWKIIPQTNIDSGDFWHEGEDGVVGVAQDGDTSMEGTLVAVEGVGAGCVATGGNYRMTINMMDYTYSIQAVAGEYYMTGNPNGWASDYSAMFFPVDNNEYSYTTYYNGSWDLKFWDANEVGNWDYIYGCSAAEDNNQAWNGSIVYSNGDQSLIGCITSPTEGYYTLYINMGTMTYYWEQADNQSPAEYALVSITGDFNGWGDYLDMTQVAPHNWYYEGNIPSDGGLKFLVDHAWDVNWGADQNVGDTNYGIGEQNGANITVPAGNYRIYLNDINGQFIFVAE